MKRSITRLFCCLLPLLMVGNLSAQEIRTDGQGKQIKVYPDGSWEYVEKPVTSASRPGQSDEEIYRRLLQRAEQVRAKANRQEIEYRTAVQARVQASLQLDAAKKDEMGTRSALALAKEQLEIAKAKESGAEERYKLTLAEADDFEKVIDQSPKKQRKFLARYEEVVDAAPALDPVTRSVPDTAVPTEDPERVADEDKAAEKAAKADRKAAEKAAKVAAKAARKEADTERPEDYEVMATETNGDKDKAAKKAAKAARKEAKALAKAEKKAAKEARQLAKYQEKEGIVGVRVIDPPAPEPKTKRLKEPEPLISKPADAYARYSPEQDIMLNPPSGECVIAFEGEDSFTGKYRKETTPQLFFAYTPPQLRSYITDRDYVTAYGSIIRIGGGLQILVIDFYVASQSADKAFGTIPRNGQLNIKTLAGENVLLLNSKVVRGRWDAAKGHTHYRAQYIVDSRYEAQLLASEVDQIRMVWETGYDDIPIYELDFFQDQFNCLNSK